MSRQWSQGSQDGICIFSMTNDFFFSFALNRNKISSHLGQDFPFDRGGESICIY
jgi:hypothetical protein